ncbi:Peptidase family M23 [Muriicola jejuensis]|uniref:Peptidoglycan DD-metalloendopeptidase family protein n=1 Tax=Muriicola jejuensis TaxID=504488 RepID=A0A6P0UBL7_9FLAO|nr:M23 family metallopeptidase [Muriicola jejuensis]NER09028.1 peptidoglycan DD-metalloendopeptidase family protein [Muriicola jejuensis]SMP11997.1 Peptidase family M23 [Muriicola jejuensis]
MKKSVFLLCIVLFQQAIGQENYPRDAFRSPLDIPLILAGTFGELRSNHFHSGIDIKTQQREGLPVYAIADGTVTRIKVSHWGYGKALYIAHPNGYTSVYAHLQKFSPEIEAFVKEAQYRNRSYEIEVFPEYGQLKVITDSLVAYTGNTGGSSGPHLHFEIRSSLSERPTNPLLYGLDVRDATNPTLEALYAYPLSADAVVNRSEERVQLSLNRQADGSYLSSEVKATGTIGFGISAYDRQDLAANQNGLYELEQKVNGRVISAFDFDSFSFGETRLINTLIDYEYLSKYRRRIQRCFKVNGNDLSIYKELENDGKLTVLPGMNYTVEITLKDLAGNSTRVIIPVQGNREEPEQKKQIVKTAHYISSGKPNNFDLGKVKLFFPPDTFYEDFYIDLRSDKDTVTVHNNSVPVHKNFTITFDTEGYEEAFLKSAFIARLDERMRPDFMKTYKRGNTFSTRTRSLGTYTLARDTVPPVIRPKNFKSKQWLTNYRYLSLLISDDLSGIASYEATLNGEWILMEYEPKNNTITYNFDDKILDKKQCDLKVVVTDNVGNSTTFTSSFFRS